jgi:hypothetical protein
MSVKREHASWVDLYWLPLGAGGQSVRLNGRIFESVVARLDRRVPCDLYHSALEVRVPEGRFVIEQAPVRDTNGGKRGVVAEGAVGSKWAGRFRIFRYELRCWHGGVIPDVDEAVESPRRLTHDLDVARRVLDLAPFVPTAVWGRDELGAGEMWNSNSVIAWLLERSGVPTDAIQPPERGRAPGWRAGLVVARRTRTRTAVECDALVDQVGRGPRTLSSVGRRAGFPQLDSAGAPRHPQPAAHRLEGTRGGTSVDTVLVRHLADLERRRRHGVPHLRSRELVGWNADPGRRPRPEQAACATAEQSAARRVT